LLFFN